MKKKKRYFNIQVGSVLLVTILVFCISFFSCSKEDVISSSGTPINSDLLNGKAEITARFCKDLYCNEVEILKGLEVELAIDTFTESGKTLFTNEDGKVIFSSLQKSTYIIKASYNDQLFIERFNVTRNGTSFHEIVFSPFCVLEGNRLIDCDRNIRFNNLSVGQYNDYQLYISSPIGNDTLPKIEYTTDTLTIEIVEKLDNGSWLVREHFKKPEYMNYYAFEVSDKEVVEYSFEVRDNMLSINERGDYSKLFFHILNGKYKFDLNNYDFPICDQLSWSVDCGETGQPFYALQDPQYFVNSFSGIFRNHGIVSSGVDGAASDILFNGDQGLIHTFYIYTYPQNVVYGFTKIK